MIGRAQSNSVSRAACVRSRGRRRCPSGGRCPAPRRGTGEVFGAVRGSARGRPWSTRRRLVGHGLTVARGASIAARRSGQATPIAMAAMYLDAMEFLEEERGSGGPTKRCSSSPTSSWSDRSRRRMHWSRPPDVAPARLARRHAAAAKEPCRARRLADAPAPSARRRTRAWTRSTNGSGGRPPRRSRSIARRSGLSRASCVAT